LYDSAGLCDNTQFMKSRVLVSKRVYPPAIEYLRQRVELEYNDSNESYSPHKLIEKLKGKQGVVCQVTDKFTPGVMDQLPDLKIISNIAVGVDNIDLRAATARKILVTHTPDVLTDATADFAFALLLAAARRVVEGDAFIRSGQYKQWLMDLLVGHDVHHRTLGLVGMGRIGQAMARRARGFSMRILYYDSSRRPAELERELGLEYTPFDQLLSESDFVSLHVPLAPETRHMIGGPQFAIMKRTAILINTARGPVVDEAALAAALAGGRIAGAGLDVYEEEPKLHPGLQRLKNVVLAPHIASGSHDTRIRMCMLAAENLVAGLSGKLPPNLVNRELMPA